MSSASDRIAVFTIESMAPETFNAFGNRGQYWLWSGASLLRSARWLLRQHNADLARLERGMQRGTMRAARAGVQDQAVMLAAMAVECALKAIIAETKKVAKGGKIKLGRAGSPAHNLVKLAKRAGIEAQGQHEKDALHHGLDFITWIGRYPTPMRSEHLSLGRSVDVPALVAAYERIYRRAAEETALAQHKRRSEDVSMRTKAKHLADVRRRVNRWLGPTNTPVRGAAR